MKINLSCNVRYTNKFCLTKQMSVGALHSGNLFLSRQYLLCYGLYFLQNNAHVSWCYLFLSKLCILTLTIVMLMVHWTFSKLLWDF